MTFETVIDQSNQTTSTSLEDVIQSDLEEPNDNSNPDEQPSEAISKTSLVFIPCTSKIESRSDSPKNCQVQLPPHLQKRLLSSKSAARKSGKSKEDLEDEQKKAEERRQKLHLEAKKRRKELDMKMKCVMVNYDFICKQHMIRKGVKIEGEQAASAKELNHAVRTVKMQMNDLNAGLRKNLNEAMKDAMKL